MSPLSFLFCLFFLFHSLFRLAIEVAWVASIPTKERRDYASSLWRKYFDKQRKIILTYLHITVIPIIESQKVLTVLLCE